MQPPPQTIRRNQDAPSEKCNGTYARSYGMQTPNSKLQRLRRDCEVRLAFELGDAGCRDSDLEGHYSPRLLAGDHFRHGELGEPRLHVCAKFLENDGETR